MSLSPNTTRTLRQSPHDSLEPQEERHRSSRAPHPSGPSLSPSPLCPTLHTIKTLSTTYQKHHERHHERGTGSKSSLLQRDTTPSLYDEKSSAEPTPPAGLSERPALLSSSHRSLEARRVFAFIDSTEEPMILTVVGPPLLGPKQTQMPFCVYTHRRGG